MLALKCTSTEDLIKSDKHIALMNGLFNTETYQLEPFTSDVFSTVQILTFYDPEAECPNFLKALDDIFLGDKDQITLVQEIFGYCCSSSVRAEKAFFFIGNGRNGKSTLIAILRRIVGLDNVSTVALKDLGRPFARAQLLDKLLNVTTEAETGRFATEEFKAIVSGDAMQFERKHENAFTAEPYCTLVSAFNRLPQTLDVSDGFMQRLTLVPFPAVFVDEPTAANEKAIDRHMAKKLEAELPGIFRFAIDGLKRLIANNYRFSMSAKSQEILKEYTLSINPYLDFVDTAVTAAAGHRVTNENLYDGFLEFCLKRGWRGYLNNPRRRILAELRYATRQRGIQILSNKSNSKRGLIGITLKPSTDWE